VAADGSGSGWEPARSSKSEAFDTRDAAVEWVTRMERAAARGVDPNTATTTLSDYGNANMKLALRGLEVKTTDPYLAGWRKRVVPTLGQLRLTMITSGALDRTVHGWIADECSRSTVKNSLAVLVRVMEQGLRDGIIDRNPARVTGWQREYKFAEDELDDPRALAPPDWNALTTLADALVARSVGRYQGWGDAVIFEACTAARIGQTPDASCAISIPRNGSGLSAARQLHRRVTWSTDKHSPLPAGWWIRTPRESGRGRVPLIDAIHDLIKRRIEHAPVMIAMLDCSPVPEAAGSPPPPCAPPRHGTRWSPTWGTSS
jgi:hypothetical protein